MPRGWACLEESMARSLTVISLLSQSATHCRYRVYIKFLLTYTAIYRRNRKVLLLGITALQPQSHFHLGTPYRSVICRSVGLATQWLVCDGCHLLKVLWCVKRVVDSRLLEVLWCCCGWREAQACGVTMWQWQWGRDCYTDEPMHGCFPLCHGILVKGNILV